MVANRELIARQAILSHVQLHLGILVRVGTREEKAGKNEIGNVPILSPVE